MIKSLKKVENQENFLSLITKYIKILKLTYLIVKDGTLSPKSGNKARMCAVATAIQCITGSSSQDHKARKGNKRHTGQKKKRNKTVPICRLQFPT